MNIDRSFALLCFSMLCITIAMFFFSEPATAQSRYILFPSNRVSVGVGLDEVQSQSALVVSYNRGELDDSRMVLVPPYKLSLSEALDLLLDREFRYTITNSEIIISKKAYDSSRYDSLFLADRAVKRAYQEPSMESKIAQSSYETPLLELTNGYDKLPAVALKTNVLYGAATLTPNLALEIGLSKKSTLELSGSYNPWNRRGSLSSNKKLVHVLTRAQYRYWLCERYNGHFIGGGAIYTDYNVSEWRIPGLFKKEHRYEGYAVGGEFVYGHQFMLGKKWGLELGLGVGVMRFNYDKYDCTMCDREAQRGSKTYFGPTNASISLVFLIK